MKYTLLLFALLLFLAGCSQKEAPLKVVAQPITLLEDTVSIPKTKPKPKIKQTHVPRPPHKQIVLKEVKDDNFDDSYMYPVEKKKQTPKLPTPKETTNVPTVTKANTTMTKAECISMITQEKFDKYTAMFGNEEASLKRCKMLKAMK